MNGLNSLNGWTGEKAVFAIHNSRECFNTEAKMQSSSCGSVDPDTEPTVCGSSRGTGGK